jgi:phytanoyl-CoA hydroxylase
VTESAHGARVDVRRFRDEGWVRVDRLIPPEVCASVREAFATEVRPYDGPLMRQLTSRLEPHERSVDGWITNPVVNPHLLAQFPVFQQTETRVMRAGPLVDVVGRLLEAEPAMLQSAYYESSRGTRTHVDFNPLDRDRPMIGAWIALEDIGPGAGRFEFWPGSHRIPDDAATRRFAELAWTSYRQAFVELAPATAEPEAQALLAQILVAHRLVRKAPPLRAGDALFWTNRLLHGSAPPRPGGGTRCSLLFHFVELDLVRGMTPAPA